MCWFTYHLCIVLVYGHFNEEVKFDLGFLDQL